MTGRGGAGAIMKSISPHPQTKNENHSHFVLSHTATDTAREFADRTCGQFPHSHSTRTRPVPHRAVLFIRSHFPTIPTATATATATATPPQPQPQRGSLFDRPMEFCPIARWSFARSPDGVLPDRPMEFCPIARSPDGVCPIAPTTPARFIRSHNRSAADRTYGLTNINRVVCRFKKYD